MANLSICLQYYIHDRMNTNPAWKNIKVHVYIHHTMYNISTCTCIIVYLSTCTCIIVYIYLHVHVSLYVHVHV